MPDPLRVLIIVPAFNEAQNLPGLLRALREVSPRSDICVVDDGSTDQTARVAREAGATVLRHPVNLGIGGAVQAGYLWAREHDYDVAGQIDGDGHHAPAYIGGATRPPPKTRPHLLTPPPPPPPVYPLSPC